MSRKIQTLVFSLDSEDPKQKEKAENGLQTLCRNRLIPNKTRVEALEAIFRANRSDIGCDLLCASRDSLVFLNENTKKTEIQFLLLASDSKYVDSFQRLLIAVLMYNLLYVELCYDIFSKLSRCPNMLLMYRLECLKFLVFSEIEENMEGARNTITEIVKDGNLSSLFRYRFVAEFSGNKGLRSLCNIERLWTIPPAEFTMSIQLAFFSMKEQNEVTENILSSQCLLQLEVINEDTRKECLEFLVETAERYQNEDQLLEHNTRADACDVLMRLAPLEYRNRAQRALLVLSSKEKGISTIYEDRQNVHTSSINESAMKFLEKCVEEDGTNERDFASIHSKATRLINDSLKDKDKTKALAALDRISIDTATFTQYELSLADSLVYIWRRIEKKDSETSKQMFFRLLEELVDMAGTCSSGHCSRLVNSLSYFEQNIRIGFGDQVKANYKARMNTRIRNLENPDLQSAIVCGMGDSEETEDRKAYIQFIRENFPSLRKELEEEFVCGGYMPLEQFNSISDSIENEW